ncbi:RNA-directed DNA polymerase (reverse transcriptase)-related family protein [Rhynchospora pubera]|uniref:RNA-directed DNA polymerase (Reverse transcriptase)-related family protein n=1 Tax=Rhynchospora pubera TaxID=906938 RepID=A0AAV8D0P8_9POAL|nr:RNA-directed DNA polymerase (reverse transcriptase)-related family protein [Rhynchospora pubera]
METSSKFQKKLNGWSASLLSIAGRTVLVNACFSSFAIYFMSAFKLPTWVIKKLDAMRRNFLWHGFQNKKLILISWDKVCMPKSVGGLGVIDLSTMNEALLARWLWIWLSKKESIWSSRNLILQNKKISTLPLNGQLQPAFMRMESLFSSILKFNLGDGKSVPFWHFDWGWGVLKHKYHILFSYCLDKDISVSSFSQNVTNLAAIFRPAIHTSTIALHQLTQVLSHLDSSSLSALPQADTAVWNINTTKLYSTKSLYNFIKKFPKHGSSFKKIWKLKIPPRMVIFLWQMLQNRIATIDTLKKRGWVLTNICYLCRTNEESVQHLFNECLFTQQAKQKLLSSYCPDNIQLLSTPTTMLLQEKRSIAMNKAMELLAILLYLIWRERCQRIFNELQHDFHFVVEHAILEWKILNFKRSH